MNLLSIVWNVNPIAFSIGSLSVRWYGICWAVGIYLCYLVQVALYKRDKCPEEWADKLFMYIVIGAIVGARLGHCFFYEWHECVNGLQPIHFLGMTFHYRNEFIENPLKLIEIWNGGLASHGGAIGIIIAAILLDKKHFHKGLMWMLDRLVIGVAITAFLIRLGNLMNSEIYGGPTDLPWGFSFPVFSGNMVHGKMAVLGHTVPCHPTQIYEMLYCVVAGVVSAWLYYKTDAAKRTGLIFGVWIEIVFFTRFMLEFIKNDQEAFEANFFLNMGQILSLPFIIWAAYLIIRAYRRPMTKDA